MSRLNLFMLAFAALLSPVMTGCVSSAPWERSYTQENVLCAPLEPAPLGDAAPVQVRPITWDRMELALREWERDATNSDIHPEEWDQAKRTEVKGRLLKNLQVSSDPNAVMVVGRSTFKTTDTLRPDAEPDREQLRKFARKVGATTVVWSRKEVGKADAIVQEPVTSYSTGSEFSHGNRFDRASTVWVPIRIKKNESAFVAVFLR